MTSVPIVSASGCQHLVLVMVNLATVGLRCLRRLDPGLGMSTNRKTEQEEEQEQIHEQLRLGMYRTVVAVLVELR